MTAKGFQAIRMLMDGYTNREIGEMFGVPGKSCNGVGVQGPQGPRRFRVMGR